MLDIMVQARGRQLAESMKILADKSDSEDMPVEEGAMHIVSRYLMAVHAFDSRAPIVLLRVWSSYYFFLLWQ